MNKIKRLEKMRYSILTNDLSHCYMCGQPKQQLHEIYYGKNRVNSMKYGCVVPLCMDHHIGNNGVHHCPTLDKELKKICQIQFEKVYPDIDFIDIFHKNYI